MSAEQADLTGTWHPQFTYPRHRKPVFFVATLMESAGWIDGTTQEPRPLTGRTLDAAISGRRSGSAVTFVKTYRNGPPWYGVVHYGGTLNADGTEVEGSWQISRDWSGRFLMIRGSGTEEAIARQVLEFAEFKRRAGRIPACCK